jgi:hypothetical protein
VGVLLLVLFAASRACADDVFLSTGPARSGTILQLTTNSLLLLQPDGKPGSIARSEVTNFTLDFPAGGRCARLTSRGGTNSLLVLSSFDCGRFSGTNLAGVPAALPLADIREAVFYPVAKPRHILDLPYVRQKPDYCGEACIEMLSTFLGRPVSQDRVNELAGLGGKRGCYGNELAAVINKLGLKIASDESWPGSTDADFLVERMRLLACLQRHHPVLLGLWGRYEAKQAGISFDHIVMLIGYDLQTERFIIHDPGRQPNWAVTFSDFIKHRQNSSGTLCQIEFALFRDWKTLDGKVISSELLELNDRTIQLKPAESGSITLDIDKLDPSGRAFVEKVKTGQTSPLRGASYLPPNHPDALYASACECALKGDKEGALQFLTRAVDAGFINFVHIQNDADLTAIREEAGFKALLANKDKLLAVFMQKMSASILKRLGNGYSIGSGTNSPYIMISNADPQKQKTVEDVLRVVADLLGKTLFTNKPTAAFIVVIPNTMQDFTQKMGGKSTSAGFYNHANRTLTINLSTGTGTLVHEFTHALHFSDMEARGQMHPTWVREGLGSLYEESDPKEDRLDGLVNWRLPLLKQALQSGQAFAVREFLKKSPDYFAANAILSYAMSRYLFYFLQSKQLLFPWYARYCEDYAADPTGILTLEKVYGKPLAEFEKDWIAFVQTLK